MSFTKLIIVFGISLVVVMPVDSQEGAGCNCTKDFKPVCGKVITFVLCAFAPFQVAFYY